MAVRTMYNPLLQNICTTPPRISHSRAAIARYTQWGLNPKKGFDDDVIIISSSHSQLDALVLTAGSQTDDRGRVRTAQPLLLNLLTNLVEEVVECLNASEYGSNHRNMNQNWGTLYMI